MSRENRENNRTTSYTADTAAAAGPGGTTVTSSSSATAARTTGSTSYLHLKNDDFLRSLHEYVLITAEKHAKLLTDKTGPSYEEKLGFSELLRDIGRLHFTLSTGGSTKKVTFDERSVSASKMSTTNILSTLTDQDIKELDRLLTTSPDAPQKIIALRSSDFRNTPFTRDEAKSLHNWLLEKNRSLADKIELKEKDFSYIILTRLWLAFQGIDKIGIHPIPGLTKEEIEGFKTQMSLFETLQEQIAKTDDETYPEWEARVAEKYLEESPSKEKHAYIALRRFATIHSQSGASFIAAPSIECDYRNKYAALFPTEEAQYLVQICRDREHIEVNYEPDGSLRYTVTASSTYKITPNNAATYKGVTQFPLGNVKYTFIAKPNGTFEVVNDFLVEKKVMLDFINSTDIAEVAAHKFLHDLIIDKQNAEPEWKPSAEDIELLFAHSTANKCPLDLSNIILPDISIPEELLPGANLSNLNLSRYSFKNMDLSDAILRGADLRGADLRGADLRGAEFVGAKLSGATLNDRFKISEKETAWEARELIDDLLVAKWDEIFFEVTDPKDEKSLLGRIRIPRAVFDKACSIKVAGRELTGLEPLHRLREDNFAAMLVDLYSEQLKEDFAHIAYTHEEKGDRLAQYANLCRVLGKKCDFSKIAASSAEQKEFQARVRRVEIEADEEQPAAAPGAAPGAAPAAAVTTDSDTIKKISIEETEKRIKETASNYVFYRDIIAKDTIVAGQLSFPDFIKNKITGKDKKVCDLLRLLKPADMNETIFFNDWTIMSRPFQHFKHAEDHKRTVQALTILWLQEAFPELASKTNEEMMQLLTPWENHYIQNIASPTLTHFNSLNEALIQNGLLLTTPPALTLTFKDGALHGTTHSVVSVKNLSSSSDGKKAISAQWGIDIRDDGVHLSCSNKSVLFCIFEQCADKLHFLVTILNRDNPATDFSNLNLRGIDFSGANLSGANLSGATIDSKSRLSVEQLKSAKWSSFNYAILDKDGNPLTTVVVNREEFDKVLKKGGDLRTFVYQLARAQVEYRLSDDYAVMHEPLKDLEKQALLENYNLVCKAYDKRHDLSECKIAGNFRLVITSNTLPPKDVAGFTGKAVYQYRSRDGRGKPIEIDITKNFLNVLGIMPYNWVEKFKKFKGTDAAKILQIIYDIEHKGSHEEKRMLALAKHNALRDYLSKTKNKEISLDQAYILIDTAIRAGVNAENAVRGFQLKDDAVYEYKNKHGENKIVKFSEIFTKKEDAISAVAKARVSDEDALLLHKKMTSSVALLADASILPKIENFDIQQRLNKLSLLRTEYLSRKDTIKERLPLSSFFNVSYTATQKLEALDSAEWKILQALENGTHLDFDSLPKAAKQGRLGDALKKLVIEVNAEIDAKKARGHQP